MELHISNNGDTHSEPEPELRSLNNNGIFFDLDENQRFTDDIDSSCSTPYVSAPSSPGRNTCHNNNGYFFSAPASPMHFITSSSTSSSSNAFLASSSEMSGSFEFDFSARYSSSSASNTASANGSMSTADELFLNGQIRPMKLSSHLQRPQVLAPLIDLENEDEEDEEMSGSRREEAMIRGRDLRLRNRSLHRRARSLSPLRNSPWHQDEENEDIECNGETKKCDEIRSTDTTPSVSAASSRNSSAGRSSKRWEFLKDFLRSKSEGRGGNVKEKFWYSLSFSPIKDKRSSSSNSNSSLSKEKITPTSTSTTSENQKSKRNQSNPAKKSTGKPANGVSKRRVPPSAHEIHYTAKRAQAEEMKKKTFLPYRQGLLGCLGFSSKGYGAMNGFARSLNPVSTR
ncbi:hypothetical protein ACHQM5_026340 [Ranunculus cassubicifolius]